MKLFRTLTAAVLAAVIALSAAAAFTPSVEYKEAPQVVEKTDTEGNTIVGEIKNESGEVVGTIPTGAITITALSATKKETSAETEAGETGSEETAEAEVAAEIVEKLQAVEEELTAEFEKPEESTLVQEVAKVLNNAPVENIVISEVFAVTSTPEIDQAMEEGTKISVAVASQSITKEDEDKIVIFQKDAVSGEWKEVEFTIDDNNVITLELEGAGEVVIFRDSQAAPEQKKDAPKSPSTRGNVKRMPIRRK